jgi:ribulose-5-phosphate 4-epimerase/fuculose-1-phosphate aldolase
MIDEGYTKFRVEWTRSEPLDAEAVAELDHWRGVLHEAGLVGHDDVHDVGYGNLSVRYGSRFIISGTQTGHIARTGPEHYALVTGFDIAGNRVFCSGPVQASSESLTHAAIYAAAPDVMAIVHAHDNALWLQALDSIPTTRKDVPYGTPDMAEEFRRLLHESAFAERGVAAMGGHEGGLISTGGSIGEAAARMLDLRARILGQ